jgi:hypothetical protein
MYAVGCAASTNLRMKYKGAVVALTYSLDSIVH